MDFRLQIKIKNNRILKRIEELGYKTVSAFCEHCNLNKSHVYDYINFKLDPINRHTGGWKTQAQLLADSLYCMPEDLFDNMPTIKCNLYESQIDKKELETVLIEMMESAGKFGDAVRLHYFYNWSKADIARFYEVSPTRAAQLVARGLRYLKHPTRTRKLKEVGLNKSVDEFLIDYYKRR